ncbi:MAG: hypothetical protein H6Q10_2222 [Acidobacteria bacterium]|nr:hypothetical protein [Acidobacteriota bacterium]
MSSETSTKPAGGDRISGFQPWHLFLVGSLLAASAAALAVRGSSPANVLFTCLTIFGAGWSAYLLYRACRPLVEGQADEGPEMLGGRTRAALEREKTLVLRAIKELEFDRAMRKVSEADYQEMTGRLRTRAVRLIRQLDEGQGVYRDLIEKELAARQPGAPGAGSGMGAAGVVALAVTLALLGGARPAMAQMGGMGGSGMPDPKAMSGIPLPTNDQPAGTVTVRLIRGSMANPITGHAVEFVLGGGRSQAVTTDENGRATLSGAAPGSLVRAVAVVDGERLESQDFEIRADAGIVLLLAATDKAAAGRALAEAVPGTVTLSGQSRILIEFQEDAPQLFYVFDIVNRGQAPVKLEAPLVFEMPSGAKNTSILEGSSPQAVAKGPRVVVEGPFVPGITSVQAGATLPSRADARIRLRLPAALDGVTVIAEKVGPMVLQSAQVQDIQEANSGGRRVLVARGPALKAGATLDLELKGLPHHPTWPRNLALALAVAILAAGVWGATRTSAGAAAASARAALEARRARLLDQVARLDEQHRKGGLDPALYGERREALLSDLERVYGELDTEATTA